MIKKRILRGLATVWLGAFVGFSFSVSTSQASHPLKLKINAECLNGVALFRVTNKGEQWPKSAYFMVYRATDNTLLNRRRLRMAEGQQASFKISKGAQPGDELAIYIEPGWYKRAFHYDGKIVCR